MIKYALPALLLLGVSTAQSQSAAPATAATSSSCAALSEVSLPHVQVTSATTIEAGAYPVPEAWRPAPDDANIYKMLPAFCRVTARLTPTSDSDIKMEVWLPLHGWNGKFRGQGNGGFAGVIDYDNLALAVDQGYATAGTDTGHAAEGTDASWALHHPEKIVDFGHRAIHEMTQTGRFLTTTFYAKAPTKSYFAACSDGGREALMEAERYPDDYDGILAGAPANYWSHLLTSAIVGIQALRGAGYIPAAKLPAISAAVLNACDKLDGVVDGVLNDPRACHFDPAILLCKSTESDQCLTGPQVKAMQSLYAGIHDASGKLVFPGLLPGAELGDNGWATWITGAAPGKSLMYAFGTSFFTNMVYSDPSWAYENFKVDAGIRAAEQKTAAALDATDPNLKPFLARGGKLILYHGWNDPAIPALNTINFFNQVVSVTGRQQVEGSVRLYMAPGVQHCGGGPGPDTFGQFGWTPSSGYKDPGHNLYSALEEWVEQGKAPERVIASKFSGQGSARRVTMSRPLCPYPQQARHKGAGDPNDASSFTCSAPE